MDLIVWEEKGPAGNGAAVAGVLRRPTMDFLREIEEDAGIVPGGSGGPVERRWGERDRLFMKLALGQARRGLGWTSPNPAVGAVVARGGEVLAVGHHRQSGGPHAERAALEGLRGVDLSDATLYVNLEPCCHYGATPPCTDLILERGIGSVVSSIQDPNPLVSGKGFRALTEGGARVEVGLMGNEAKRLNEAYLTRMSRGTPLVSVKVAATLDGRIADASGRSKWITGPKARSYGHYLRAVHDAVVVGSRTALLDDPHLGVRLVRGRSPAKLVIDPILESVRAGARILDPEGPRTVYICGPDRPEGQAELARAAGVELWEMPVDSSEGLDLGALLEKAAVEGFSSVLVEGGAATVTSFLKARAVDKIYLFEAPRILGAGSSWIDGVSVWGLEGSPTIRDLTVKKIGSDVLLWGYPDWSKARK